MIKLIEIEKTYEVKGIPITFMEKIAVDEETGEEIFDPALEQENDKKLFDRYRELKGLLTSEKIKEIRLKFEVTQVQFAQILGFGDKTMARYENGSLQDMVHNNLIKLVSKEPLYFLELLRNCKKLKEEMPEEDYKTLLKKVKSIIEIMVHFKLEIKREDYPIKFYKKYLPEEIALFILKYYDYEGMGEMISPLKLQKQLNYVYSYCLVEWDYKIFEESPQAWAHGPVFPSVYEKYSSYKYMNIDIPEEEISLHDSNLEKLILKIAIGYGIHSAKDLEKLTHREDPWKRARKRAGVSDGENCKEKILDSDIREYFEKLLKN